MYPKIWLLLVSTQHQNANTTTTNTCCNPRGSQYLRTSTPQRYWAHHRKCGHDLEGLKTRTQRPGINVRILWPITWYQSSFSMWMVGILSCRQTFKAFKVEKREDETANWRVGNQDDRSADVQTSCHNNFHLQGLEGGGVQRMSIRRLWGGCHMQRISPPSAEPYVQHIRSVAHKREYLPQWEASNQKLGTNWHICPYFLRWIK